MRRRAGILGLLITSVILGFAQQDTSRVLIVPDLFQDASHSLNAKDLFRFSSLWWLTTEETENGDLNGDGRIDSFDLLPLKRAYQVKLEPETTPTLVPTPISTFPSTPTILDVSPTPAWTITPTGTPVHTPSPTFAFTLTPTPPATATLMYSPTHTPTPTVTFIVPSATPIPTNPKKTPSPTPAATGTETLIENESTITPSPAATQTPTAHPSPTPDLSDTPTPTIAPPEFVRLWHLHPSLNLFNESVTVSSTNGYAASEEGYAVAAQTLEGENRFISIDRFGRIFNRMLPISLIDYSGLSLVDGGEHFGKFFESPAETRRFRFEPFGMDSVSGDVVDMEHLGADAIAWTFCGTDAGSVMAVLRYPNRIVIDRLNAAGEPLGQSVLESETALPAQPALMLSAISGDQIAILYSANANSTTGAITPLTVWILGIDGEQPMDTPITIGSEPLVARIEGDDAGTFFMIHQSSFGLRLIHFSKDGLLLDRILSYAAITDLQWQDDLLWLLDGTNNVLWGVNEEGVVRNGPVSVFPPGWNRVPQWLRLKKSGPDLGAFFHDPQDSNSIQYMQIEAGEWVTPTPVPASGVPTGVTSTIRIEDNLAIDMVEIKKGTYSQGSPDSELGRRSNEGPVHTVTLTYDFYISQTEITNQQYRVFDSSHQSSTAMGVDMGLDDLPVTGVSWEEADAFCEWLTSQSDYTFSLPTEAEWEYVARAGTTTRRPWGEDKNDNDLCFYANSADVQAASTFTLSRTVLCDDGFAGPAPVGTFPANALGVYDMLGNVNEWCLDWFEKYSSTALTDPTGPSRGTSRVVRGGAWNSNPDYVRCAYRSGRLPDEGNYDLGFRVVIRE